MIHKVWVLPSMHKKCPMWLWEEDDCTMMVIFIIFFDTFTIQRYLIQKVSKSNTIAFVVIMTWVGW